MIKYVKKNNVVMDFLLSRRSNSAQSLVEPIPNFQDIDKILSAAARTPDHGKLVPWRFLVLEKKTMPKLAQKIHEFANDLDDSHQEQLMLHLTKDMTSFQMTSSWLNMEQGAA